MSARSLNAISPGFGLGRQWKVLPKDLSLCSTARKYLDLWDWDRMLGGSTTALMWRSRAGGPRSEPTTATIDSQTAKGAVGGAFCSTRSAMTLARRCLAGSAHPDRYAWPAAGRQRGIRQASKIETVQRSAVGGTTQFPFIERLIATRAIRAKMADRRRAHGHLGTANCAPLRPAPLRCPAENMDRRTHSSHGSVLLSAPRLRASRSEGGAGLSASSSSA